MSDVHPIDETLDRLEHAVAGLTSTTNIDALRYIHQLGQTPGCSRHALESARYIAELCTEAESSLMESIGHLEAERDDSAHTYLGHALVHLDKIAETVASVTDQPQPRDEAKTEPHTRRSER